MCQAAPTAVALYAWWLGIAAWLVVLYLQLWLQLAAFKLDAHLAGIVHPPASCTLYLFATGMQGDRHTTLLTTLLVVPRITAFYQGGCLHCMIAYAGINHQERTRRSFHVGVTECLMTMP